ncbi:ABC transporter substrate-binding protein [Roseovarius sp. 2305UL8-3]|uniref:ABC transporter substrate-binding protein n=1 Tax=Roseovarius conchicola TaxID=3121636 RepID=UPI00352894DF
MSYSRNAFRLGVASAALALVVAAAPGPAAHAAELKAQVEADFGQLDPAFWQSSADLNLIHAVFPKLIEFENSETWEWKLSSAESIEQVDDLTITFTLKPGLMWTNGYGEVTAEDVEYSFERFKNEDLAAPNAGDWAPLKDVEVVDKYSGIIHLNEPFAPVWWSTLPYAAGAIISKKATEEQGGKFTTDPKATAGPYRIESWDQGQRAVLVAHYGWNGDAPGYDRVELIPINDPKAAEVAFGAGQVDIAGVAISSVPEIEASLPEDERLEVRPTAGYLWLGLNAENPDLQDAKVREAIKLAIDVEAIIEGAYFGIPDRSTGLVAPGLVGHREIDMPARDVAAAQALMAEAGVSSLDLELEHQNSTDVQTAALIIQANLAEIGINVQINTHETGTFWSLGDEKGANMQMTLKEFTSPPDPAWSTQWFLEEQAGIWNWEWFKSDDFEKLHYAAMAEVDLEKRAQMYTQMQELMDASHSYIWLIHPPVSLIHKASVDPGLYPNGDYKLQDFKPAN